MIDTAHELLSRALLEPLFWRLKKMPILSIHREYQSCQWNSKDVYIKRQNKRLASIIKHSIYNIPYYKQFANKISDSDINNDPVNTLSKLPVLTKELITNNIDSIYHEQCLGTYKNSTGGSTGVPLTIYQDNCFQSHSLAATYLMYEWAGRKIGTKMVKLWGAERDLYTGKLGLKQKLSDFIGNRLTVNSFRMSSHERLDDYIALINSKKPVTIEGYADSLFNLANYVTNNKVELHSPASIVSSAGVLYPHMREKIESAFRCKVFNRYGSRDAGNIAAECDRHNGLHIFGENLYLEIVDEEGNEVMEGEEGIVLISLLHNYTMPLIRYEIGDRAVKGGVCSCGRPYPLIKEISGRQGSSFITRNGGSVSSNFFVHLLGVSCNDGSVRKFQAIQTSYNTITIKLVVEDGFCLVNWGEKDKIGDLINKAFGYECEIDYIIVDDIPPTPTGKHLYTICEI